MLRKGKQIFVNEKQMPAYLRDHQQEKGFGTVGMRLAEKSGRLLMFGGLADTNQKQIIVSSNCAYDKNTVYATFNRIPACEMVFLHFADAGMA